MKVELYQLPTLPIATSFLWISSPTIGEPLAPSGLLFAQPNPQHKFQVSPPKSVAM
jgi:hypothetical protein